MKNTIIMLLITLFISDLNAQESTKDFYLTTNLLAPIAGINKKSTVANVLTPLVSNLEYGMTISGGYFKNKHSLELRLTYGKSNDYNVIPQIQFGYNFFVFDHFKNNKSGWYIGGFGRYWLYHNRNTKSDLSNFTTNLTLGYCWKKKQIIADLRLNQPLTIFSMSDISNTQAKFEMNFSPMPLFTPVLPFLSINVGYQWKNKSKNVGI